MLEDAAWRDALRQLFVPFADAVGACCASPQVERSREWSGRSAWSTSSTEQSPSLAGQAEWDGLPPHPVWWSWFGAEFTPLVIDHLPVDQVQRGGTGLLHARSEEPHDRDELARRLPGRSPSLPQELLARPQEQEEGEWSVLADRAPFVPPGLDRR